MQTGMSGQIAPAQENAFSFALPRGSRPDQAEIRSWFAQDGREALPASLSHISDPEEGWVELLASGLTFDLQGLVPAPSRLLDPPAHVYGFPPGREIDDWNEFEVVSLAAAGHVAGGAGLAPVIRAMAGLAANLALSLPVSAVLWPPAHSAMEPAYFARSVFNWLAGGAFPALGLTSLVAAPDGSIASVGLSFFTGMEMQLEAGPEGDRVRDMKLAVRLADYLVARGIPETETGIRLDTQELVLEPSRQGRKVWGWRSE